MSNKRVNPFKLKLHLLECEADEKDKKISDLEARLAESEKKFIVANDLRKNSDEVLLNYKTKKYGLDKTIQELRKTKLSLPEKEWYYKGFENCERQMSSHIADLTLEVKEIKQQLKESEEEKKKLEEKLKFITEEKNENFVDGQKYNELKQQLAEKEKEIEKYRNMNMIVVGGRSQGKKYFMQVKIKELQNQKAIEQLEKVKYWCKEYRTEDEFGVSTINVDDELNTEDNLLNFIDNQIKQLKEMK